MGMGILGGIRGRGVGIWGFAEGEGVLGGDVFWGGVMVSWGWGGGGTIGCLGDTGGVWDGNGAGWGRDNGVLGRTCGVVGWGYGII